jgi:hypothetical protein
VWVWVCGWVCGCVWWVGARVGGGGKGGAGAWRRRCVFV